MTTDSTDHPKDKSELLDRIRREWTALITVIEALSAVQMARQDRGGWTLKDNLAHVTEWERFLIRNQFAGQAAHAALGIDQALFEKLDEAGMNAALLERIRERPLSAVLADLYQTHDQLIEILESMPENDLQKPSGSIGPKMEPKMLWIIYNTYEHYLDHRRTIQANSGE